MITRFVYNKKSYNECISILDFLKNNPNWDFYYTNDNVRFYITDFISLRNFLRKSEYIYVLEKHGDCVGIILIWKSLGGNKKRYYLKMSAIDTNAAYQLLTILLWQVELDLYAKIRKDSPYLQLLKSKNFKFHGGRGCQMLLKRDKVPLKKELVEENKE